MQEFIQLFDSEEYMERDYLKNILRVIYTRVVSRRKMIRKVINDCLLTIIHETQKFNGTSELLDILASIISGFAVPLRKENVVFFKSILIPLYKVQTEQSFHEQLYRCSQIFISKDNTLAYPLVDGILRYWPISSYHKEYSFLNDLQYIIESCEISKLEPLIPRLFKRLIRCISCPNSIVAGTAIQYFEIDFFLKILVAYKQVAFPIIVPVIVVSRF